jgi:hypothetical protein
MIFNIGKKVKKLSRVELGELRALTKIIKEHEYVYNKVAENSVMVQKGQQWLTTQNDILKLLKNARQNFISGVAAQYGFTVGINVTVNLETGEISQNKGEVPLVQPPIEVPKN